MTSPAARSSSRACACAGRVRYHDLDVLAVSHTIEEVQTVTLTRRTAGTYLHGSGQCVRATAVRIEPHWDRKCLKPHVTRGSRPFFLM